MTASVLSDIVVQEWARTCARTETHDVAHLTFRTCAHEN